MGIALLIYHAVNVFTDLKWRVTKNIWHLLFFMGGVMLSVQALQALGGTKEILIFYALSLILWLCIGVFLEVAVGMYSPGDTKMMTVSALWLASSAGEGYGETLAVFGLGVCVSLLMIGLVDMTRRHGIKRVAEELKRKLFFWISLVMNPFRIIAELRNLRKRIRQEQENPSMKTRNIPAAIPIAAGTVIALMF